MQVATIKLFLPPGEAGALGARRTVSCVFCG